jgi:hypothetical protein
MKMTTADALPVPTVRFRPGRKDESAHKINGLTVGLVKTGAMKRAVDTSAFCRLTVGLIAAISANVGTPA